LLAFIKVEIIKEINLFLEKDGQIIKDTNNWGINYHDPYV
jgi:hypothetical protein